MQTVEVVVVVVEVQVEFAAEIAAAPDAIAAEAHHLHGREGLP